MDVGQYEELLRTQRLLVLACALLGALVAGALVWPAPPRYTAETQLFVSSGGIPGGDDPYQRGLFAQNRAISYAEIISGRRGAQAVIANLQLTEDADSLAERIRATVPLHNSIIDIAATDRTPEDAQAIARSLGSHVGALAATLEPPGNGGRSPIRVTVTKPATLPVDPDAPQVPLYVALGVLLGLALGVALAALRRSLDRRIIDEADAAEAAGSPVLCAIPGGEPGSSPLAVLTDPRSASAQGYYGLRARLANLRDQRDFRSLLVSSAVAGEGKTEVVANLGVAFAESGERTLVIDANLRSPRLAALLETRSPVGLTDVLTRRWAPELVIRRHPTAPLDILASGAPVSNPGRLLGSSSFEGLLRELTEEFDVVLVDGPALLPVADARILAPRVSGTILAVRSGSTSSDQVRAARKALRIVEGELLGLVLNGARQPIADSLGPRASHPHPLNGARRGQPGLGEARMTAPRDR